MVENQHGLGSILSFSAKSVNPKILEALLIGRKKIVDQLENRVKNIAKDGLNHQVLIIGARGTGKTHLLSVLHYRIQTFISQKKIKVAYFAEEEYGISGYLDFMVRILNAFIRWNEEDAEFLKSQLSILQETPPQYQEETIKRIIREYIGDNPLLILAENFNDIIDALKKEGQSKLRNWLQENNRISIIATSQALSDDIGKEDKPFYGFFDEISLKPLTLEESFQLLKSLAEIENRKDVIEHLENKGNAQVKAINTLVKGNHRLLITFYEFLKSDILSNLSVMFIKTLNDLKPYYETYIRYLPPQQQKILRFIALSKTPQMGTEIARECFIDQKSLSKQLSELNRKKLIEIILDTDDKRNKLYDIAEPLLRISIEIGEQKEGISALFIDFLALYYNQNELNNQKQRFSEIYKDCTDPQEKEKYSFEISARERALLIQSHLRKNQNCFSDSQLNFISEYLSNKEYDKITSVLNDISIDSRDDIYYYIKYGVSFFKKEYDVAIKDISKAIEINPRDELWWEMLGNVYFQIKEYISAIDPFKKALEINPKNEDVNLKLGVILSTQEKFKESFSFLEKTLEINPKNQDALILLGVNYSYQEQYEKSINTFKEVLKINPSNANAIIILTTTYIGLNQIENVISLLYKSINNESLKLENKVISFAITKILKYDKNLNVENCLKIETLIKDKFNDQDDLKISLKFIQVYRKVILEKNKRAFYQLPKEQREFFQNEIIDFREQQKS